MVEILILIFSLSLSLACISLCIYNFQIKEYRFDRLLSYIKEKSIWFFIVPERFYVPKKSIRNRNIVIISFVLLTLYFLKVWLFIPIQVTRVFFYFLSPVFSILFVIIGVLYTSTIVKRKREITINEAIEKINKSKAVFIGVTGSFGKTSTKEFLYKILSSKFEVEKTDENQNTDIGVAMSINKNFKDSTQYFIVEMGAYKQGEIEDICNIVHPKYGILTGLSNQHLGLFGSKDNLISAKSELLKSLPNDGKAYVNADSEGYEKAISDLKCGVCLFSTKNKSSKANIFTTKFSNKEGLLEANVSFKDVEDFVIDTNLLGEHTFSNLLPCIALSYDLGVSKELIEKSIKDIKPVNGRLSTHLGLSGAKYLYDGYSSNVKGFLAAMDVLGSINSTKKTLITKGIIELGEDKEDSYKDILKKSQDLGIKIITTDTLFKELDKKDIVLLIKSEKDILKYIKKFVNSQSTVLIEGRFTDKFISSLNLK
jgi:UDP-N-acetylmuramoyl-tripeptide--D-alanyl-D-alanine ligase